MAKRLHLLCVRRSLAGAFLALASLAGGCTSVVIPGETIVEHSRAHIEDPGVAPSDGEYILVHKYVDMTPLKTVSLSSGDRLGFMTGRTGEIIAVAGEDEWVWTDNDYIWVRKTK